MSRPLRSRIERGWTGERSPKQRQEQGQEFSEPGEDASEVVADGGEDDVGSVSCAAFEIATAQVTFGLEMTDDRLDGGSASQLALDNSEDTALLAGNEDAPRILRVVAAVSLVDIGPLDRTAGERFGAVDDVPQGVTVVRIIGQRTGVQHEQAAGSPAIVGDDGSLHSDLWTTPALQEESAKGRSGLRQSIRLQFGAVAPSHHGYPPTSVLNNSPASRRGHGVEPGFRSVGGTVSPSSFRLANLGGLLCLLIGPWIFLPGPVSHALRPKRLAS